MVEIITINGRYLETSVYHVGMVYRPTERVFILPTMWLGTLTGGTANRYAKVLANFLRNFEPRIQDRENVSEIITNFERYVCRVDINRWMTDRLVKRDGGKSPKNLTIESDAHIVATYLAWAKNLLGKSGVHVPYDGGTEVTKVRNLKASDFLKGIAGGREITYTDHGFRTQAKPEPGDEIAALARSTRIKGHSYLRPDEIGIFLGAFADKVWSYAGATAYRTGMRPHEILAIPRFTPGFTANPDEIRALIAKGKKSIFLHVLGKGEVDREVELELGNWLQIMDQYEPLYQKRSTLYREVNRGQAPPPHILWLSKTGKPRYCTPGDTPKYDDMVKPLWNAVRDARESRKLIERFGHGVDFYSLRHSYATDWLVKGMEAVEDLSKEGSLKEMTILQHDGLKDRLRRQLGHKDFETTYRHYVHNAVALGNIAMPSVQDILDEFKPKDYSKRHRFTIDS